MAFQSFICVVPTSSDTPYPSVYTTSWSGGKHMVNSYFHAFTYVCVSMFKLVLSLACFLQQPTHKPTITSPQIPSNKSQEPSQEPSKNNPNTSPKLSERLSKNEGFTADWCHPNHLINPSFEGDLFRTNKDTVRIEIMPASEEEHIPRCCC